MVEKGGVGLLSFLEGPTKFEGKRRLVLELRTGLKSGFGSEFFAHSKGQSAAESRPGKEGMSNTAPAFDLRISHIC
jgi:hypothetical protein